MNKEEIKKSLETLGLKEGDIVLLHSSLASIGFVEGGAETVVEAFLETLGEKGTLATPVFGNLGIITKIVEKHPRSIKSDCPFGTISAIGADAEYICENHWKAESCHAEGSPYLKIAEKDGFVCLMGVDQDRSTTLHSVEALLKLPYLRKTEEKTIETSEGKITKAWKHYPGPHRDFIGLDKMLRESGKMKTGKIGKSMTRLIKSKDLIEICCEEGKRNPAFVLCDNPNCADCVEQKAKIMQDKFNRESFTLAASSSLAGYYAPEIIDNMKASGICSLEIDCLEGKPANAMPENKLRKAIEEFKENEIKITGFRVSAIPGCLEKILEMAKKNSIKKIIMPLSSDAEKHIEEAGKEGVQAVFFNDRIDSDKTSSILLSLKEKGLNPEFSFNAANFAAAGEKPFLQSYKKKLRKFIAQLDVEDSLFDGTPKELAKGNAEIKEMISILRCSSFDGALVLGSKNRFSGNLHTSSKSLEELLENM